MHITAQIKQCSIFYDRSYIFIYTLYTHIIYTSVYTAAATRTYARRCEPLIRSEFFRFRPPSPPKPMSSFTRDVIILLLHTTECPSTTCVYYFIIRRYKTVLLRCGNGTRRGQCACHVYALCSSILLCYCRDFHIIIIIMPDVNISGSIEKRCPAAADADFSETSEIFPAPHFSDARRASILYYMYM